MVPKKIILHHSLTADSETVSWGAIRKYHIDQCGWSDIGYHFGLERVGDSVEMMVGRVMTVPGAHCKGHNFASLGICCVGNYDLAPPDPEMWAKCVSLVKSLMAVFNIQATAVHGHNEFAPKTCPGRMFDMAKFRYELSQ